MTDLHAWTQTRRLTTLTCVAASVLLAVLLLLPPTSLFEHALGSWLSLHLLLELFAVVVAALVITVSWHGLESSSRRSTNVLVFGFTVVALMDVLHAVSYKGMPEFISEATTAKAIYFWLLGRTVQALVMVAMAWRWRWLGRSPAWLGLALLASAVAFWLGTWHIDWFPVTFVPGRGLTGFKVFFEYSLCLVFLAAAVVLWGRALQLRRSREFLLAAACYVMALGEVVFASYQAPDDALNVLGHVFKVVAYALTFRAVFTANIRLPYEQAKRTERELRERDAQIGALARNLPAGALYQIVREADGRKHFVYLSDAVPRLLGVSVEAALADAEALYGLLDPEDRAALVAAEQVSFNTLGILDLVVRVRRPEQGLCWMRVCSAPRRLEDGRTIWDGMVLDITHEKQSQEALRSSEAVLRTMVDSMPFEAWVRGMDNRMVLENEALVRRHGSQLGLLPEDAGVPPEELHTWLIYNSRAWNGEVVHYEYDALVDAGPRSFLGIVAPIRKDGQIRGILGFNIDITDRRQAERQAHDQDARMAAILLHMPGGVSRLDLDLRFLFVNEAHAAWFGQPREALVGRRLPEVVSPERLQRMMPHIEKVLAGEITTFENRVVLPGGEVHYRHTTLAPERAGDGLVAGFIAFAIDTTERKEMELALWQNQSRLRTLVQALPDMVFLKDAEGRYLSCNPVFEDYAGRLESDIVGRTDAELFAPAVAEALCATDRQAMASDRPQIHEEDLVFADGYQGRFETVKIAVRDASGQLNGVLGVSRDITDRKRAEAEIEHLAFFDPLTDLPNRRMLTDRLGHACQASARSRRHGALLFLDLDNFKDLNDTLGHDMGDQLLVQVGERLVACVRSADTVARFGGDEFVVMLEDLDADPAAAAAQTERVAEKLLASMNQPFTLRGQRHYSSPSIGIALFLGQELSVDELLKRADLAMYQAKANGRNTLRFYDPQMQAAVSARSALEGDLRQGLARQELLLYYQPVLNEQQRITGVEALVRWAHPERGMVSPGVFIPLAEQTGLILPLGQWVLRQACAQLALWATREATCQLSISVNVSARQFRHPGFVDEVREALRETGAAPHLLKLELTESLLLTDVEDIIARMSELRMEGVRFSLDDFGTGYSSLSYLKRLPLDQLKIDQSFVRDVLVDPNDAAIVRTVLALAGSLDLAVVAEGVETRGQLEFLLQSGCKGFQGYLFGRPAPVEVLEQALGLDSAPAPTLA